MTGTQTCRVCSETLAAPNVADCNGCGGPFHLQMRLDVPGKDCGEVWLHDERLHLVFGCRNCLSDGVFDAREAGLESGS